MGNSTFGYILLFVVLGGLGVAAYFYLKRSQTMSRGYMLPGTVQGIPVPSQGLLHYKNKETRDIEWTEEGLPRRITIEREYYQLP